MQLGQCLVVSSWQPTQHKAGTYKATLSFKLAPDLLWKRVKCQGRQARYEAAPSKMTLHIHIVLSPCNPLLSISGMQPKQTYTHAPHLSAGGLTKEYKARFRSLMFNLKDVANPHLRARVLQVWGRGYE